MPDGDVSHNLKPLINARTLMDAFYSSTDPIISSFRSHMQVQHPPLKRVIIEFDAV